MALHPASSKRTRLYNIFVGLFFWAVLAIMWASGVVARDEAWTWEQMFHTLRPLLIVFLVGLPAAYVYVRKGER